MADRVQLRTTTQRGGGGGGITTSSVLYASLAGVAVSGPLLGMMGLSFLASATLLVVTSPLLILFSPLIFLAGVVVTFSLAGFAVAVVTAVAGLSAIGWTMKSLSRGGVWAGGGVSGDPVKGVAGQGRDWAGYLQTKLGQHDSRVNRG